MTDGEHAAVHAMQQARADAVLDCTAAEAGIEELAPTDDAVLARGERGDACVRTERVGLFIHHMYKSTGARSSPPCRPIRPELCRFVHAAHEQTDNPAVVQPSSSAMPFSRSSSTAAAVLLRPSSPMPRSTPAVLANCTSSYWTTSI